MGVYSDAWLEGAKAFDDNKPIESCPYKNFPALRSDWHMGYVEFKNALRWLEAKPATALFYICFSQGFVCTESSGARHMYGEFYCSANVRRAKTFANFEAADAAAKMLSVNSRINMSYWAVLQTT